MEKIWVKMAKIWTKMDENGTPLSNPPPSGRGLGGGAQTPMQLVTPKVVRIAVRMATIVWMMNFQVSFFMALI